MNKFSLIFIPHSVFNRIAERADPSVTDQGDGSQRETIFQTFAARFANHGLPENARAESDQNQSDDGFDQPDVKSLLHQKQC